MEKRIQLKPVFVKTKNVRNFEVMMDSLMQADEGCLGMVHGQAGRGKTRTSQWFAANNDCIYLRIATIWRTSELGFLAALCRELGILSPPRDKVRCFIAVVDQLNNNFKPIFLDEIEKLPRTFLDIIRDLSDLGATPFILIGENELKSLMIQNERVWSRTFQQLEFSPVAISDIIVFAKEAAGMNLTPDVATILHTGSSKGDFRLVKRDLIELIKITAAKGATDPDADMAKMAIRAGLRGK